MSLSKLFRGVQKRFKNNQLVGNSLVYGTLYVAAEYSQQLMNKHYSPDHPEINYESLPRFAIVGTFVYSPMLYFWYGKILDKYFIGKTTSIVMRKLILDQTIMTPLLILAFYTSMSILEGRDDVLVEVKEKFVKTYIANCMFWIPAQTVNFLLIPPLYRVLYISVLSFGWINILCSLKRQKIHE